MGGCISKEEQLHIRQVRPMIGADGIPMDVDMKDAWPHQDTTAKPVQSVVVQLSDYSHVGRTLPHYLKGTAATAALGWPALGRFLTAVENLVSKSNSIIDNDLAALREAAEGAIKELSEPQTKKEPAYPIPYVRLCQSCHVAFSTVLGPVAVAVENELQKGKCKKGTSWDTLTAPQLLGIISTCGDRMYEHIGKPAPCLHHIGHQLMPVALLLQRLQAQQLDSTSQGSGAGWHRAVDDSCMQHHELRHHPLLDDTSMMSTEGIISTAHSRPSSASSTDIMNESHKMIFQRPLDAVVNMMRLVLYRKVSLETQEGLAVRQSAFEQVAGLLNWSLQLLASCCKPPQRVLLLSVAVAAGTSSAEQRVRLTVRRNTAFWDALKQLQLQGVLPRRHHFTSSPRPSPQKQSSGSLSGRRYGIFADKVCKLFPSFVDEWLGEGGGALERMPSSGIAPMSSADLGATGAASAALEAGEGHGPRKEFFMLAGADAAGQSTTLDRNSPVIPWGVTAASAAAAAQVANSRAGPALLVYNRAAGVYWYNTMLESTPKLQDAFFCLGWLLAQSVLNYATLGLPLSPIMMQQLLRGMSSYTPTLRDLQILDPTASTSLQHVTSLPAAQLKGLLELEGLSKKLTAQQYIQQSVQQLLVDSIKWQAQAMSDGFKTVIKDTICDHWKVSPSDLAAALSGNIVMDGDHQDGDEEQPLDLRKVFRVVMDPELSAGGKGEVVGELLWGIIGAWPRAKQLQFVEFATGTRRLPLPGTELLKVECPFLALSAAEYKTLLATLPQAHTCDNTFELPNYWSALLKVRGHGDGSSLDHGQTQQLVRELKATIEQRLETAVQGCVGYGLDDRDE